MNSKASRVFSLILFLLLASPLYAQISAAPEPQSFTFFKRFNEPANCTSTQGGNGQLGRGGVIKTFFVKYDHEKQTFLYDILFEKCDVNGALANGFQSATNAGPNPKGHPGELAMGFFDFRETIATGGKASPIVTIYGYNGKGNSSYFDGVNNQDVNGVPGMPGQQVPDRIISSINNPELIMEYEIVDSPAPPPLQSANNPFVPDSRRIYIKISTQAVNNHTPLWPVPGTDWYGKGFNRSIGSWFHPVVLTNLTKYCDIATATADAFPCANIPDNAPANAADGFLEKWSYTYLGWYDSANNDANGSPTCIANVRPKPFNQKQQCYEVDLEDDVEIRISLNDYEGDPFRVTETNSLPSSAEIVYSEDIQGGAEYPFDGKGQIEIKWTPTLAEQDQMFFYGIMFEDEPGAMGSCGAKFCVAPNGRPSCDVQITSDNPDQCDGEVTKIEFSATGSTDPDGDTLEYFWDTDCPGELDFSASRSGNVGTLSLTGPGMGEAVENCSIFLTVKDPYYPREECSVPVQVDPCDLDCLGDPNGSAQVDECGVCEGDGTSCLDCAGSPNGDAIEDICGVCGGDGTSCLDCLGNIIDGDRTIDGARAAVIDQCGVCDGNGLSCVECDNLDITGFQQAVDSRVTDLERTIRQVVIARTVRLLDEVNGRKRPGVRQWARKSKETAKELREAAWTGVYSVGSVSTSCTENAEAVCVEINNTVELQTARTSTKQLLDHGQKLANRLRRTARKVYIRRGRTTRFATKKARRIEDKALATMQQFHDEALASLDEIPNTSTNCAEALE